MRRCQGCGTEIERPRGRRKWCNDRCRRDTLYGGTCVDCGARTNGSDGPGTAPERCGECRIEHLYGERNRAIIAMWNNGVAAPLIASLLHTTEETVRAYVASRQARDPTVARRALRSRRWIREARDAEIVRLWNAGMDPAEIAERLGFKSEASLNTAAYRLRASGQPVRRRRAIRQLTDEQVARVRRAHREGSPSIHSLAREFGVADNALWQIIQGKSYKDVPDAR